DVLVIAPGSVAINATSKIAIPAGKIQRGPEVRRSGRANVSEMTDTTARVIGHLGSPTIRSDIGILPAPAPDQWWKALVPTSIVALILLGFHGGLTRSVVPS